MELAMNSFETSATVEQEGQIHVSGVPFAPGTQVEVVISPRGSKDNATTVTDDPNLIAARLKMSELFTSVKGFRMTPKFRREELYDR
jgi:hypothetical protein